MQKTSTVTVPFMLLGILFNICLVASNLLETKVTVSYTHLTLPTNSLV